MSRLSLLALAVLAVGSPLRAQDSTAGGVAGRCATPDSIAVRGNQRVSEETIRSDAGLAPRAQLNFRDVQRALKSLYTTGQFDDANISCSVDPASGRATLVLGVRERPVLESVRVTGTNRVSNGSVRDKVELLVGRPIDPALVARAVQRIDSLYEKQGYFLARVRPETTFVGDRARITFRIDEGRRLAISGVRIRGNREVPKGDIVGAMKARPEGFWWFRKGEFDEENFAGDLAERIPELYGRRGLIDFQVVRDTVIIDRERGKALLDITVAEGPRYGVGSFEVVGSRRFSSDEIAQYFPFTDESPTLTQRVTRALKRQRFHKGVFDESRWDEATTKLRTAYSNEGYIYANIRPVVEREVRPSSKPGDSVHVVNLRWEIDEKSPAIINRVEIAGNDYTSENCIRSQLVILPGDVFNQDRLLRSYQNIANLGFFETPLPPPDTRTANEQGDVDIVFRVKEKRTGNVNFGASMGQGTGVGGFIGLDQPNLFGQCKRGSLQWQYGRYINDFNLSYTDPAIRQGQISGTVNAYHSQARYRIGDLGRITRTGGSLQFGFPVMGSPFTRLYLSYGGEGVKFGAGGLLGDVNPEGSSFRSTIGLTGTHDTRIDLPFATAGGLQSLTAQFNGGPLGGDANFQRYTTELRGYAPVGQFGGDKPGSQPIKFVLGLTGRAGAVFGSTGNFFSTQEFALGGVQYGEQLRGYPEFSITPDGFVTGTDTYQAQRASFGSAFLTTTAEFGMRVNQQFYANIFYDAGNIWRHPREFDPTRLFRGAGIGLSVVTPLGPLGLDWAYGFDRLDAVGRPDPKWQLHFKLGQLF
jgi:outer membrane protein insertion porin family